MTANKHTPFLSNDQVQELNEKHGWFKHGDAQSDVSRAFANDAVAAYERVRSAAPELLEALEEMVKAGEFEDWDGRCDCIAKARAAIAKATGGAA